jgi:hypothetical protein
MDKLLFAPLLALAALASSAAEAQVAAAKARLATDVAQAAPGVAGVETIAIEIRGGGDDLWTGTLRVGGNYGNASFSQSVNEFIAPCPSDSSNPNNNSASNRQLNFNISRRNPQQDANLFYINVNWTRPLPACQGEGNDTFGFNRVVSIPAGGTVTIEGVGGLSVKLSRRG